MLKHQTQYLLISVSKEIFPKSHELISVDLCSLKQTFSLALEIEITSHLIMAANSTMETDTQQDTFLQEARTYMTYKILVYIDKYWFPVLIPFGLVGNTLSFLVMFRPNNRRMSTCIYMAAISINDNIMLLFALHDWLVSAMDVREWYVLECKINAYFAYFSLQTATYQVLVMTIDKYVAIKWPHKAATYSTPRRAKIMTIAIFILVLIYNIPHFFITTLIGGKCYGYSVKGILTKVYSWFTIVINAVIPFTLLIHMNYVIVKIVRKSRKMFRGNTGSTGTDTRQKSMKTAENQLTTMLLLVTTLFLILVLTTYIRFIYAAFVSRETPSKLASSMLVFEVSYKLYVTNSGINFFLYCVSGQKFRNDLKEIICCSERSSSSSMNSRTNTNTLRTNSC